MNKYFNNFGNYIPSVFTHLLAQLALQSVLGHLSIYPPDVYFLDEDWPSGKLLDVQICSDDNKSIENPLELSISNTKSLNFENERKIENKLPFEVFRLNESCSGLILTEELDVPSSNIFINQNEENQKYPPINSPSSQSYSLLFEDLSNKDRATLQIEVVDVNDNPPYFLGGPFPLELIIPAGSPPGFLIRRLEIIDFDQGIGGISIFSLISDDNKNNSLFSLNSPQCKWPKCSVELRLKESMFEGERASIKVLARDGAGITHKRSNTAEIKINVVAVSDIANNLNKNEGEEEEENKEEEEEDEFNEEKDEIFFNSNFRKNISLKQNITIGTTTKGFTGLFEKYKGKKFLITN